jgi:hypothetical protein
MGKLIQNRGLNTAAIAGLTLSVCLFAELAVAQGSADSGTVSLGSIPRFYLIRGWEATVAQTEHAASTQPVEYAVERLCRYYGGDFSPETAIRSSLAPLEWPHVFESHKLHAHRQRLEVRALFEANGLEYREIIPLDLRPSALADSVARAVAQDQPVLLNSPDAALVYGYDRREPDHWWWFDHAGAPEIVLESERTARYTYWTDDQAGGIAWAVTGMSISPQPVPDSANWQFLRTVVRSIQGIPEDGVDAYPLSLRDFRELLASSDSLPSLSEPVTANDPLGIMRAKMAREFLLGVLQGLGEGQRDSIISESIKLSEYHLHSAISSLSSISTALYGPAIQAVVMDSLIANWMGIRARRRALEAMTDLLKAEKLATESLQIAVSRHDELAQKKSPVPRRRR